MLSEFPLKSRIPDLGERLDSYRKRPPSLTLIKLKSSKPNDTHKHLDGPLRRRQRLGTF